MDVVTKVRDNVTKMLSGLDLKGDKHRFILEFPSMDSKTSNLSFCNYVYFELYHFQIPDQVRTPEPKQTSVPYRLGQDRCLKAHQHAHSLLVWSYRKDRARSQVVGRCKSPLHSEVVCGWIRDRYLGL